MSIEDVYNQEKASLQSLANQYTAAITDQKAQAQAQIDDNIRSANDYSKSIADQAAQFENAYVNGQTPTVQYNIVQTKPSSWPQVLIAGIVLYFFFWKGK